MTPGNLSDIRVLRSLADALEIAPHVLGLADTPQHSVPLPRSTHRVKATFTPEEGTDPMRRRTLLVGLTGLTSATIFGTPPCGVASTDDSLSALERALLDPPIAMGIPTPLHHLQRHVAAVAAALCSKAAASPNSRMRPGWAG